ncbi:MAG: hypothetical protein ABI067_15780 [Leifsonia sp.]
MATSTILSTLNEPKTNSVKVWDKNGEMFEMSQVNVNDMVQHMGWSRTAPTPKVEAPKAEPVKVEPAKVEPVAAKAPEEEVAKAPRQK